MNKGDLFKGVYTGKKRNRVLSNILVFVLLFSMLIEPIGTVFAQEDNTTENSGVTTMASDPVRSDFSNFDQEGRINFDENWKFTYGDQTGAENPAFNDGAWENIQIPHDYSLKLPYTRQGEAESGYKLGGIGWYRKEFNVEKELLGKKFIVDFGGVYMNATIYINGKKLGFHPYGYTPFAFDLTEHIQEGKNVLAVKVDHKFPSSRWYSGSGIYRSVHLTITNPTYIGQYGVVVTMPKINEQLGGNVDTKIETTVLNDTKESKEIIVRQEIREKGSDAVVASSTSDAQNIASNSSYKFTNDLVVNSAKTWSLDNPNLYEVTTSVLVDGNVQDQRVTEYGYRTIRMDANEGFFLNGEGMKLQGVSMHHDQGSLGAQAYYRAIERQVEILKDMGVNAIRVTHNPAADELIEIANRMGMLLIDESFDGWVSYKNGNNNDYTTWFNVNIEKDNEILGQTSENMTWAEHDTKTMVRRGINSPAMIMWSLGNEVMEGNSGPYGNYPDILRKLSNWALEVDKTRFVTIGDNKFKEGWRESQRFGEVLSELGGTIGFNYSTGSHFDNYHRRNPNWAIYAAETASAINSRGQYKLHDQNKLFTSYDIKTVGWGQMAAQSWLSIIERDFVAGEFVWTGFDYLGEPTDFNKIDPGAHRTGWPSPKSAYFGIVDTAGIPKDTYYFYRSQWNQKDTTLHVLPAWNKDLVDVRAGKVRVNVYSNAKSVELFFTPEGSTERQSLGTKEFTTKESNTGKYSYQMYEGEGKSRADYENLYLRWDVPYEDGTLTAVAYDANGNVIEETVGRNEVSTYKEAKSIDLTADRQTIKADGKDLSYIMIDIKDEDGKLVDGARNEVSVEVSGDGELLAMDNGDQTDHEPYHSGKRTTLAGKAIAIVKSTKDAGSFTVTAKSNGLETGTVTVNTEKVDEEVKDDGPIAYTLPNLYYVKLGTYPEIDDKVTLHYADKEDTVANVKWNHADYSKPGTYTIVGNVEGVDRVVRTTIVVLDEIAGLLNYSVAALTNSEKVNLPGTRPLIQKDGKVLDVAYEVKWDEQNPEQYKKPGTYTVKGKSRLFGEEYDVLASIRITEGKAQESTNIAPSSLKLEEYNKSEKYSDNLQAIKDGDRKFKTVIGGKNNTVWTNYDAAQDGEKTAEIVFSYATAQVLYKADLYHYQDAWSARLPGDVKLQYTTGDDDNWIDIDYKKVEGEAESSRVPNVTPHYYTFEPTSATKFKIILTTSGEDFGNRVSCVGLTEVELFTSTTILEQNSSALLSEMKLNDLEVKENLETTRHIYTDLESPKVEAKSEDNAAVTVLPEYEGKIFVITESEDNSKRLTYTVHSSKTDAKDVESDAKYEIYPKPHEIKYENTGTVLTKNFNTILEDGLDQYTVAKVDKILKENNIANDKSEELSKIKTNLLVGIKGSDGFVDKYFKDNLEVADIYDNFDAYQLIIKGNTIAILAKDTDAAFYGLVTLETILKQVENDTITHLTINDYSSTEVRGIIEGYYGVPWGWTKRADMIKFGSQFKNNVMIFAPKDDPYHRDQWRDLYPEEDLAEISKLAKLGNEEKNRFVWTIAPFHQSKITASNIDESMKDLIAKFDQLYDAGVRQFGVLGDDVGTLPHAVVVDVMQRLQKWVDEKGDVYDLLFCPASYVLTWAWNSTELNAYEKGFPESVKIFFTGRNTCTPIFKNDVDEFKTKQSYGNTRRDPLFWLNWPVNDIDKGLRKLYMGDASQILHNDVDNIVGAVTNPMQEAYASWVSVFAVADYAWNIPAFDGKQNWEDAFKYIDPSALEELKELSRHMANTGNAGIPNLEESENLKTPISEFENVMNSENKDLLIEKGNALIAEYKKIVENVDGFIEKTTFDGLKEEILPYITGLKEKSLAAINYIEALIANANGNKDLMTSKYDEAEKLLEQSKSHKIVVNPKGEKLTTDSGTLRINSNITKLKTTVYDLVQGPLDEADRLVGENIALNPNGSDNSFPLGIASFTNDNVIDSGAADRVYHLNDGIIDFVGNSGNRWTNWQRSARTSGDWAGILFGTEDKDKVDIVGLKLAIFEDTGVRYPESYTIEYYTGPNPTKPRRAAQLEIEPDNPLSKDENWTEVTGLKASNFRKNVVNNLSFDKVNTLAIRVKMKPQFGRSLGLTEMEVYSKKIVSGPFKNPYITEDMIFALPQSRHSIWENYRKARMIDKDDETFTWWNLQGNSAQAGDKIGIDLGKTMKLGRFRMVMGEEKDTADYYNKYIIKYSNDKVNWTSFGEEIKQDTNKLVTDIDFEGIEARYVVVENLEYKPNWVKISDFMVETTEIETQTPEEPEVPEEPTPEPGEDLPILPNPFDGKAKIVSVDAGRKYFSVDQIKKIIDDLSEKDYTHLHLLLGNDGMRFVLDDMTVEANGKKYESDAVKTGIIKGNEEYARKTWIRTDGEKALTQTEMDEIFDHAKAKNIEIIPAINMPGHMDSILTAMKEVGIENPNYEFGGKTSVRTMDLTKPEVIGFMEAFTQKYIDYFKTKGVKVFNYGSDEYSNDILEVPGWVHLVRSNLYQKFADFVNNISERAILAGMRPMAYNDGYYFEGGEDIKFNKQIIIGYWTTGWDNFRPAGPKTIIEKGHDVLNVNDAWYYVVGRERGWAGRQYAMRNMKGNAKFDVNTGPRIETIGSVISLWYDQPSVTFDHDKYAEWTKTFAEANPDYFNLDKEPEVPEEPQEPEVDKKVLEQVLESISKQFDKLEDKLTEESKEKIVKVLEEARAVLQDDEKTQEEVDAKVLELAKALELFEFKKEEPEVALNTEVLEKVIELAKSKLEKPLEENTKKALEEALKEAEKVLSSNEKTQEQIDEATISLVEKLSDAKELSFRSEIKKSDTKIEDTPKEVQNKLNELYPEGYDHVIYDIKVKDQFDKAHKKLNEAKKIEIPVKDLGFEDEQLENISVLNLHYDENEELELIKVEAKVEGENLVFESDKFSDFVVATGSVEKEPEVPGETEQPEEPKEPEVPGEGDKDKENPEQPNKPGEGDKDKENPKEPNKPGEDNKDKNKAGQEGQAGSDKNGENKPGVSGSTSGNKKSGGINKTSGKNVKTGDAGIALSVMALMAAGGASLVLSRRKRR